MVSFGCQTSPQYSNADILWEVGGMLLSVHLIIEFTQWQSWGASLLLLSFPFSLL